MKQLCARSKSARKFALIILTSLASLLPASAFAAASYYVSKTGADTNPGTEQQPWLTIQPAANVATPGSTVYVHAGTYLERVNIHVSGNSQDGYITFCNYPGEKANRRSAVPVRRSSGNMGRRRKSGARADCLSPKTYKRSARFGSLLCPLG